MEPDPNRIRTLRLAKGWSLQQLAEGCGTTKSQIDKLEKGERRLTVDWMVRLAKPLGCDPRVLLPETAGYAPLAAPAFSPAPEIMLPVLGAARGGNEQEMFLKDGPIDQVPRPHYLTHVRDAYAIYVVGNSMVPMYRPRQLLFVHPHKPPTPGSGVVIVRLNNVVQIKEFVKQKTGGIVVREYHPALRDFTIPTADIRSLHAVVGATEPQ